MLKNLKINNFYNIKVNNKSNIKTFNKKGVLKKFLLKKQKFLIFNLKIRSLKNSIKKTKVFNFYTKYLKTKKKYKNLNLGIYIINLYKTLFMEIYITLKKKSKYYINEPKIRFILSYETFIFRIKKLFFIFKFLLKINFLKILNLNFLVKFFFIFKFLLNKNYNNINIINNIKIKKNNFIQKTKFLYNKLKKKNIKTYLGFLYFFNYKNNCIDISINNSLKVGRIFNIYKYFKEFKIFKKKKKKFSLINFLKNLKNFIKIIFFKYFNNLSNIKINNIIFILLKKFNKFINLLLRSFILLKKSKFIKKKIFFFFFYFLKNLNIKKSSKIKFFLSKFIFNIKNKFTLKELVFFKILKIYKKKLITILKKKNIKFIINLERSFLKFFKFKQKNSLNLKIKGIVKKKRANFINNYNFFFIHKNYNKFTKRFIRKFFFSKIILLQTKRNVFANYIIRNFMRVYFSVGHFFSSGPRKSSLYASQLVGYNIGSYINRLLIKFTGMTVLRKINLIVKSKRSIKIRHFFKGLKEHKINFRSWVKLYKIPIAHGYIRLRKQRCL
jgi:hypothetical protein